MLVWCKILQPLFEKLPYNLSVKQNGREVIKMFMQKDLYEEEDRVDSEQKPNNFIFLWGYAMIRNELGQ